MHLSSVGGANLYAKNVPRRRFRCQSSRWGLAIACAVACAAPRAAEAQTHYTFTRIADSASNPEVGTTGVYCVALSNSGTVLINSSQSAQMWRGDGTASPTSVGPLTGPICPSINGWNEISHFATAGPGIATLVRDLNGATTTLASSASAPFLYTPVTYLPSLNESGHAVFQGGPTVSQGGQFRGEGIYVALGGNSFLTIYDPSIGNHPINSTSVASLNDNDVVAFSAMRTDATGTSRIGIYRNSTTPLVEDGGAFITNVGLNRPVISNADVVAFYGRDLTGRTGIFTTSDGANFAFVGSGGFSPGHDRISINNSGKVAYDGTASSSSGIGIFTGPDPVLDRVIRGGDVLDGSTVENVFMWEEALNDSGQVAFWAQLTDGRWGVYRADPPSSCPVEVTATVAISAQAPKLNRKTQRYTQTVTLRNGDGPVTGPLSLALDGLSSNATLLGESGRTACAAPSGSPYVDVGVGSDGVFTSRERATVTLEFTNPTGQPIVYTPRVLAGSGSR